MHNHSPFFYSRSVDFEIAGPERGEEPNGGNVLGLIQIRVAASSLEKFRLLVM